MRKLVLKLLTLVLGVVCVCSVAACSSPEPPAGHSCESKCQTCQKCTDENCTEDACKDKCQGHNGGNEGGEEGGNNGGNEGGEATGGLVNGGTFVGH